MSKALRSTALAIALLALAAACAPSTTSPNAAGLSLPSMTHGQPPLTAVGQALARGATGQRDSVAQRHATRRPCPNVHSYVAWYCPNISHCGLWLWTCACACVPTKFLGFPPPVPWNVSQLKATGVVQWASSSTTSSNVNEVALANKKFKSEGILTSGIDSAVLGLAQSPSGNIYVGQSSTNQILVFAAGSTYPTTLTEPNLANVYYLATDKAGDLFVDGLAYTSGIYVFELDEMKAGSSKFLRLPIKADFPGGIAVDRRQDLWVADQGNGTSGTISEYLPPSYEKPKTSFSYAGDDTEISIDSSNNELVAANNFIQSSSEYSAGVVYSLPSGKVLASAAPTPGPMYGICFQKPTNI